MKYLFLLLLPALLIAGCKKSDTTPTNPIDQLPPATHTGANTFGCLINGEPFSVSGKSYIGHPSGVTLQPSLIYYWYINGQFANRHISMQFDFKENPNVPGTFAIAGHYPYRGYYFYYPDGTVPTGSTEYHTDSTHTGTVTITHYTKTFAAGTFQFDAMNGDGDVVHITEGRFDIQF